MAGLENGFIRNDESTATGPYAPLAGRRSGYEDYSHGSHVLYILLVAILRMAIAIPAFGESGRGLLYRSLSSPFSRIFQRNNLI